MLSADHIIVGICVVFGVAFIYILWSYARELRTSPRELWIITNVRLLEGMAYYAISFSLALWLSVDCGLGDVEAGFFVSILAVLTAIFGLFAGPFVDVFGIKKSFIFTFILFAISRIFMSWMINPSLVLIFVFLPFAIAYALLEPAGLIYIKRYTTPVGASFGFGMIYVVMQIAVALGVWGFDKAREFFGENAGATLPVIGHLSTYQIIFFLALVTAFLCLMLLCLVRDGVELGPEGIRVSLPAEQTGTLTEIIVRTLKKTISDISATLGFVMKDRYFWKYLFIVTITLFARFTFFHFLFTFPKYGLRVLGEGAKVGTVYGTLNPVLVIFLVPLVAAMTKKFSTYRMLIIGTAISSLSVFIVAIPGSFFSSLTNSMLGELAFVKWLGLAPNLEALMASPPSDFYWPLFIFLIVWTVGEATWYPKLLQLMTELAPKGNEGTYIAFVLLPTHLAILLVGPMSGLLLKTYTPLSEIVNAAGKTIQVVGDLSHHYMVWVWIGWLAILTPIGLIIFRNVYYSMKEEQSRKEVQTELLHKH